VLALAARPSSECWLSNCKSFRGAGRPVHQPANPPPERNPTVTAPVRRACGSRIDRRGLMRWGSYRNRRAASVRDRAGRERRAVRPAGWRHRRPHRGASWRRGTL
jgi:hypothetical protein